VIVQYRYRSSPLEEQLNRTLPYQPIHAGSSPTSHFSPEKLLGVDDGLTKPESQPNTLRDDGEIDSVQYLRYSSVTRNTDNKKTLNISMPYLDLG